MLDISATGPPTPKRIPFAVTGGGETRLDEYYWLRDRSDPDVLAYLEAENAYLEALTAPHAELRATLYDEILSHIVQTDLSVPYRLGAFRYYTRTQEGSQYPIYARVAADAPLPAPGAIAPDEQVLIDGNVLGAGHPFFSLGAFAVSDDGTKLAYSTDTSGYRQYTLFVKDLISGSLLDLAIERVDSVIWAADDATLWYVTEDATSKRADTVWRRRLGATESVRCYFEADEEFLIGVERSRDRAYAFVVAVAKDTSETQVVRADQPEAAFTVFRPRRDGFRYFVDHAGDRFYIRTDDTGPDFAVATVPDREPQSAWTTIVPSRPGMTIESLDCFADYAVLGGRRDGLTSLDLLTYATNAVVPLEFDEADYTVEIGINPEFATASLRYTYQSFTTPASVMELDVATGRRTLLKRTEVPGYDPAGYVAERWFATADDGTRIPVSLVGRRDVSGRLSRDGSAPLLLYGYGSYGISIDPTFSPARLALLDRGMVFAVAHIRGGGELGEAWRLAGNLERKRTTFDDFITCAEQLVQAGIAAPDRIVIQGGSAGGLLLGAVLNARPELFAGAIVQVPFVDVLTTMLDDSLPLTTGEYREWGNPGDPAAYAYIKSYSPYDNVAARPYPAVLVGVSLNDSQVPYWEGAKYAARLRRETTSGKPILLKTNLSAGHGGASGRYDAIREVAFNYAFALGAVGLA